MNTAALLVALLAAGQAAPPRDARTAVTGTATIRGRVVAVDTGRPLGLATITARAPELGEPRSISSSGDGRYELRSLPAGRYTLSVSRNGYLTIAYGQTRPLEQGKPLQVGDGQTLDGVDFLIPRASAITGRVTDELGEPIAGALVVAAHSPFSPPTPGSTNEAGEYRISGLGPGAYLVRVQVNESWPSGDRSVGFPVTYFPDSPSADGARRIGVRAGEEIGNIDLLLLPARAATISGTLTDSQGRPLTTALVGLQSAESLEGAFQPGPRLGARPVDGRFSIPDVMPGAYTLTVHGMADGVPPADAEAAMIPVAVNGVDFELSVATSTGWSVIGRVTLDAAANAPLPRDRVFARASQLIRDDLPTLVGGGLPREIGRLNDDATFSVQGIFGRARVLVDVPQDWTVKSIRSEGRDIAGIPIEAKSGEALSVEVVLTNRLTQLTGEVAETSGAPSSAGTVVVFSADRERWYAPSGFLRSGSSDFIRSARPDQRGSFQINGLPPGEYLAVAIDYVPDRLWFDPSYLDSIRGYAQPLTLADGESKTVSLKLVTP